MARVKFGKVTRSKRKRSIKRAKGYYGLKKASYKKAHEQVVRSMHYAFVGRKEKKRDFRKLWITRINAAVRPYGLSYSCFMFGLKAANIDVNRKMLSELAIENPSDFEKIVHTVQKTLNQPTTTSIAKPVKKPIAKTNKQQKKVSKEQTLKENVEIGGKKSKIVRPSDEKDLESHAYLKQIEEKYASELVKQEAQEQIEHKNYKEKINNEITDIVGEEQKKSRKVELEKERLEAQKTKAKMSMEERAKLDGSDSIDEDRQELQKHANKLRSLVDEKETSIHATNLRDMTKKELIKFMRAAANKINKKK